MKKVFAIALLLIGISCTAKAQFLSPYQSAAGSSEMVSGDVRLSVSIGQVLHSANVTGQGVNVSQGILASTSALIEGKLEQGDEQVRVNLKVYPNPVINLVNIRINQKETASITPYRVELFDMFGRKQQTIYHSTNERISEIRLNTKSIQPGQYFIRLVDESSGKAVARFKIVKVKRNR